MREREGCKKFGLQATAAILNLKLPLCERKQKGS